MAGLVSSSCWVHCAQCTVCTMCTLYISVYFVHCTVCTLKTLTAFLAWPKPRQIYSYLFWTRQNVVFNYFSVQAKLTSVLIQSSARPSMWFETNTKTCIDFWFISIPIPRHVLISNFNWDQYQDFCWFLIHFKINTKTSLAICFYSRPIPRVLCLRNTISISIPIPIPIEFFWNILREGYKNMFGIFQINRVSKG